jgi:hypothetical protein
VEFISSIALIGSIRVNADPLDDGMGRTRASDGAFSLGHTIVQ